MVSGWGWSHFYGWEEGGRRRKGRKGRRGRRRTTTINNKKKEEEGEEMFHHRISLCLVYLGNSKIAFPLGLQSHRRKTIQMCKVLCKCLTLTGKGMWTGYGSNLKWDKLCGSMLTGYYWPLLIPRKKMLQWIPVSTASHV